MSIDFTMNKLLIFIVIMLVFKIQAQDNSITHTIISGNINNIKDNTFILKGLKDKIKTELKFDEKGNFIQNLNFPNQEFVLYEGINKVYILLNSGDHVRLTADADNFLNTIKFTGDGEHLNNYIAGTDILNLEENIDFKQKYSKSEKEFTNFKKEWLKKYNAHVENNSGLTDNFKKREKRNLYYAYVRDFIKYEKYHKRFVKNKNYKVSEQFLDEFKNIDWSNEEDYRNCHFYSHLISDRLNANFEKEILNDGDVFVEKIKYINKNIKNQYIKDQLLFKNSEYNITYTEDLEKFYQTFSEGIKNAVLKEKITKIYNSLKVLTKGNKSPKFYNYKNYYGGSYSLDDFKGKYLFINVWASWCPACTNEIPALTELTNKFKSIAFINISVDEPNEKDKWEEVIQSKNLKSIQLYANKNWNSEFIKQYMIKGVPRYILIDPKGKIMNANAPRPSSKKIIQLLNELKK